MKTVKLFVKVAILTIATFFVIPAFADEDECKSVKEIKREAAKSKQPVKELNNIEIGRALVFYAIKVEYNYLPKYKDGALSVFDHIEHNSKGEKIEIYMVYFIEKDESCKSAEVPGTYLFFEEDDHVGWPI